MGFSDKQRKALNRSLDHRYIRNRTANGRELSYIEGWYAISQANRIFGFDTWCRETVETRCVLTRETRGTFLAIYTAKVRITVEADGMKIIREGHGSGEGRANSPGEVHDTALKAAETDATKRALATFGKPFGLELYRKDIVPATQAISPAPPLAPAKQAQRLGLHPDDTTPIPRPSHYYGRRHHNASKDLFAKTRPETATEFVEAVAVPRNAPEGSQ
jgi:DNA recombination protein Rad52